MMVDVGRHVPQNDPMREVGELGCSYANPPSHWPRATPMSSQPFPGPSGLPLWKGSFLQSLEQEPSGTEIQILTDVAGAQRNVQGGDGQDINSEGYRV